MNLRVVASILAAVTLLALSGCVFRDVARQQAKLDALCVISGTVETPGEGDPPVVVLLVRTDGKGLDTPEHVRLADHFVREGSGHWAFYTGPGTYAIKAFEDRNRDLVYQPGEPFLGMTPSAVVDCQPGSRFTDLSLVIPENGRPSFEGELDIAALQARTPDDQLQLSLGMLTAVGDLASLDEARFAEDIGRNGLWRPFDFILDAGPGVYVLQPYDPHKVPVLYIHGAGGTPRDFRFLIESLDRTKFQPWVYYYPTGVRLDAAAAHLDQTMLKLSRRWAFPKLIVVAHSMGGLVARAFVLRHDASRGADIPLLVTISTPWEGHTAAQMGVDRAPAVVRSWFDMAPGSPFLTQLFYTDRDGERIRRTLPAGVAYHLVLSFRRNSASFGPSDDQVITVASQLRPEAQEEAVRLYGFDETHRSVLTSEAVASQINALLKAATP